MTNELVEQKIKSAADKLVDYLSTRPTPTGVILKFFCPSVDREALLSVMKGRGYFIWPVGDFHYFTTSKEVAVQHLNERIKAFKYLSNTFQENEEQTKKLLLEFD
jgi:hypothetical protein